MGGCLKSIETLFSRNSSQTLFRSWAIGFVLLEVRWKLLIHWAEFWRWHHLIPSWGLPVGSLGETALLDPEIWNAEFPLGGKGHPSRAINQWCHKPFAQPKSSTTRKERAVFRWIKVTVQRKEKGVCAEHQIGFYEMLTKPSMKVA